MKKQHLLLSAVILIQAIHTRSFAQNDCGVASIDSAQYNYDIGRFDECIAGLHECLNTKHAFNADQKLFAYRLLAKSYLAIDSVNNADSVIQELLMMKDNFETDPSEPVRFRNEVLLIRSNMVSSVSKVNENVRAAPATVNVITDEEILQRGYTDLVSLLKDVPGFDISIYYGQLYANIYERGLRTNNTEKILLLVDGVEDNDLWSNFADISQQYPLSSIKRVEIIYGPASTMYGPNAFSGVINVITKQPADYIQNKKSFGIQVNTGLLGSYNSKYVDISTAFRRGNFSFTATARLYNSDRPDLSSQSLWDYNPADYDNPDLYPYPKFLSIKEGGRDYLMNNQMNRNSPLYELGPDKVLLTEEGARVADSLNKMIYVNDGGFDYTKFNNPSKSYYINTRINIGDFSAGFVAWKKEEGIGTTFTDCTTSVNRSLWKPAHYYTYLTYNKHLNDKLLLTAFLNYKIHSIGNGSKITTKKDYSYAVGALELKDLYHYTPAYWLTTYYYEQSEQFRSEFKLLYTQSKYFYLISGVEIRNSQLQGYLLTSETSSTPENDGTYPYSPGGNEYNVNDIGVYSQGTLKTKAGFGFTAGLRYDYNEIRKGFGYGSHISPRFVVDYATRGWVFKAFVSKGIQNVSNYTKFNDVTVIPNSSLTSETIYNYEISVSNKFSDAITADACLYFEKIKDLVRGVVQENHLFQNQNVGLMQVQGMQSNFYFTSANKKFTATVNYSYTYSAEKHDVDETGKIIDVKSRVWRIAPHKANAIVNYLFFKKINVNFSVNYVGKKKIGGAAIQETFGDYILGNTCISGMNVFKGITVQILCNNVFDKSYYSPAIKYDGIRYPDKVLQMGRNFFVKMICDF